MGIFEYGGSRFGVADEELALVEDVVASMRAREEPFLLTIAADDVACTVLWMHPEARIAFHYDAPRSPISDPWHFDLMLACARSDGGCAVEVRVDGHRGPVRSATAPNAAPARIGRRGSPCASSRTSWTRSRRGANRR